VIVLCIQPRLRCYKLGSQVGFHFATLVSPAGRIRIPFRRYDPSVTLLDHPSFPPLLSLFPRATSLEDHRTRSFVRSVMPTSSGSHARTTGLRSEWTSRRAVFRIRGPFSADPVPGAAVRYPSPTNGTVRIARPGASASADDRPARSHPTRRP
jgi:hypothetical protein